MSHIYKNPYHGCQTLPNKQLHLTARNLVAATNILVNAARATNDGTERVIINISIPLFAELLATFHTAAHEINPPNLALPPAHTITNANGNQPINTTPKDGA